MPHWRTLIEKDYLGAYDLAGKPWTLEIRDVAQRKVFNPENNKSKGKLVIFFKGADKGLISGAENCTTIENLYGEDFKGWIGKRITIFPTTYRSKKTKRDEPCIRIRPKIPDEAATSLPNGLANPAEVEASRRAHDESIGRR